MRSLVVRRVRVWLAAGVAGSVVFWLAPVVTGGPTITAFIGDQIISRGLSEGVVCPLATNEGVPGSDTALTSGREGVSNVARVIVRGERDNGITAALDNLADGKQSLFAFTGVDPSRGGSQCPWIGSLESISTSSLTMRMAGTGIRVCVALPFACHLWAGPASRSTGPRPAAGHPPPNSPSQQRRDSMGAYCLLGLIPSHPARVGEIMQVLWSDYHGPIIFGDRREIACIPHTGCRLEVVATPPSSHRKVNLLLPGQVIRYTHSFILGDRFELPGGTKVSLRHLVGFKVQLAPGTTPRPPVEGVTVQRRIDANLNASPWVQLTCSARW